VVVVGLGVLGLTSVATAVNAGAEVYAISDHPFPADIALSMGARKVFQRTEAQQLTETLSPSLADVVINTTGSWEDWRLSLVLAGHQSVVTVLGFPGRGVETIPLNPLDSQFFYMKQLRIQAAGLSPENNDTRQFLKFNEKKNLAFLLSQIQAGNLQPDHLISGTFLWNEIEAAYQSLIKRNNSPISYILQWKK
jgi:threonine dehydrogenase-like Zn-dependent dehydrogenase